MITHREMRQAELAANLLIGSAKANHIKNFALIEDLKLEFSGQLNVLTGETGAGNSILIDALQLVLGALTALFLLVYLVAVLARDGDPLDDPTAVWPEDRERVRAMLASPEADSPNFEFQFRVPLPNGRVRLVIEA